MIYDQSDSLSYRAYFIADQDRYDFHEATENKTFEQMIMAGAAYFQEMFQCNSCGSLLLLRHDKEQALFFRPEHKEKSMGVLESYRGKKWPGSLYAVFRDGAGHINWNTNIERGFREHMPLDELRILYERKFTELHSEAALGSARLIVNNVTEHQYDQE